MDTRIPTPQKFSLADIQTKYSLFDFLVNKEQQKITREMEVSVKAGEFVGLIYDALYKQYIHPDKEESLKSLNMLCVRLVFCLYAEDMPKSTYVVIPEVSSERRRYIPMGFMTPDILCSNLVKIVPDATLYHLGVLTSNVHMAWVSRLCRSAYEDVSENCIKQRKQTSKLIEIRIL